MPELRILDDDLWQVAKARQATLKHSRSDDAAENHFRERRRPKYLLSGLTRCGFCGGGYSMISADLVGCSTARNKGTCSNRTNIRRDQLEARVLNTLRRHLMDPALFKEFCDEFTREMNRLRIEGQTSIDLAQAEMKRVERELEKVMDLYLKDAMPIEMVKERSGKLDARKKELTQFL